MARKTVTFLYLMSDKVQSRTSAARKLEAASHLLKTPGRDVKKAGQTCKVVLGGGNLGKMLLARILKGGGMNSAEISRTLGYKSKVHLNSMTKILPSNYATMVWARGRERIYLNIRVARGRDMRIPWNAASFTPIVRREPVPLPPLPPESPSCKS